MKTFILPACIPFLTLLLSCGSQVDTKILFGLAVWADDCAAIACATNKFDLPDPGGSNFGSGYNERSDIALYRPDGSLLKTVVADRKIDNYKSEVTDIYYMKTRGYLLVKTKLIYGRAFRFEKITEDGAATRLYHFGEEKPVEKVPPPGGEEEWIKMIPSPRGTFIVRAHRVSSDPGSLPDKKTTCAVVFLDSTGLQMLGSEVKLQMADLQKVRWESDSILEVCSSTQRFLLGPAKSPVSSSYSTSLCLDFPTSSSSYCPATGKDVSFDDESKTLKISLLSHLLLCE
jgi:hypothetical protein